MKGYFKILNVLFLLLIGAAMLLPSLNAKLHFVEAGKVNENRNKTKQPEFDISKLDAFVKDYDKYYSDNFSLRENGIKLHSKLEYSVFGVSPAPNEVVIGKEGWFYDKDNTENYSGKNAFSKEQLKKLKAELQNRGAWAKAHNVKYYVAVVPTKMSMYPEFLPGKVIKVSDDLQYDQFMALGAVDGLKLIDVRKNLLLHKNDGKELYQHTDGHWNDLGAYYGYQEIMKVISADFPELKPASLNDYLISVEQRPGGSIVSMVNLEEKYPEQFVKLTEKNPINATDGQKRNYEVPATVPAWEHQFVKVNPTKKLKCLVIRDSFTLLLIRYLQEDFGESVFIHDEWKYRMRDDLIEKEKPDIVINVIFETGLGKLIEFPFEKK